MPKIAVYTMTRDRLEYTKKSFDMLKRYAGIDYDHYVFDNNSTDGTKEWLQEQHEKGKLHYIYLADENMGQNIGANVLLDQIMIEDYDWVMRWDNDIVPRTRRFLKKLYNAAEKFLKSGIVPVLSPKIEMLKYPPEPFAEGNDVGFDYEAVRILGGMCRLHHRMFFERFRYNRFNSLGFGEAHETAEEAFRQNSPKIRVPGISVEHYKGEDAQIDEMPDYFSFVRREVGRYVGYGL
jgi:glycosyltransferase involved in cell wall biosynthesis